MAFDVNASNLGRAESAGARSVRSPADVAAMAKTIITMLPQSAHVQEVYLKDNGILSKVQSGSLLIDCRSGHLSLPKFGKKKRCDGLS